jgi:hypothetical protein
MYDEVIYAAIEIFFGPVTSLSSPPAHLPRYSVSRLHGARSRKWG